MNYFYILNVKSVRFQNGRMTLSQRPILQQATLPVRTLNVASLVRSSNGALVLQPTTSAVQPQGIALSTLQQPIAIAQNPGEY